MGNNIGYDSIDDLIRRVRGEYLEMPGMRLTSSQASRLWGLDSPTCQNLLDTLVEARFLTRGRDGRYGVTSDVSAEKISTSFSRSAKRTVRAWARLEH
jgi:DNA-binding IclR family transcriptional regulator